MKTNAFSLTRSVTDKKKSLGLNTGNLKRKSKDIKAEFEVGSYLVYPMQGVGKVLSISEQVVLGEKKICYTIYIDNSKLKITLPLDKVEEIGVRKIIKKSQISKVLSILQKDDYDTEEDWKLRYQKNLDKIKSGDIYSIAEVCRNLSKRAKEKGLSLMERRLYESSYQLITNELSLSKNIALEDAGNLVSEAVS